MTAVLLLDATAMQLGWLSVLGVLPGVLVAWWAGAWIDRRSRRSVMIAADWVRAALIATVPIAALSGHLTLVHLGVVAALVCMASVLFEIADHAFLPAVVGRERLVDANAKREGIDAAAEITGPPLGGLLVQWLTAPVALAVDALSFVVSALCIGRIRTREAQPPVGASSDERSSSILAEAAAGLRFVWAHPLLRPLLLSTTLLTLFMNFMASLYTLYALKTLHLSPGMLGVVIGCGGIGALVGAAAVPRAVRRFGVLPVAVAALALGGLAQVFIPLAPADAVMGAVFLAISQLLGDALLTMYMVTENSLRQQAVSDEALGRAAAVWKLTGSVAAPIGMMVGAVLAESAGIRHALWGLVVGSLIAALPLLRAFHRAKPGVN